MPIETHLNDAFSRRAEGIPSEAVDRLCGIDYHPRARRFSGKARIGALAGASATTAAVVSAIVFTGAAPAFAGWTARPSTAGDDSSGVLTCEQKLSSTAIGSDGGATWSPVVTDLRGPFTLGVYSNGTSDATCLTGGGFTFTSEATSSGGHFTAWNADASGQTTNGITIGTATDLSHMLMVHLSSSQGAYSVVEATVPSDVSGVTFVESDGTQVQATTGDGWTLAWWPGSNDATSAQVTSSSGTTNEAIATHALPHFPTPTLSPSPSGASGSSGASGPTGASGPSGAGRTEGGSIGSTSSIVGGVGRVASSNAKALAAAHKALAKEVAQHDAKSHG